MSTDITLALDVPFTFTPRPVAVPGALRPVWRVNLLLLMLRRCGRANVMSVSKLHTLNWAIRSARNRHSFVAAISQAARPDQILVRFEPSLMRALDFAIGAKLVVADRGTRLRLTDKGVAVADEILARSDTYDEERAFLDDVRGLVPESAINSLLRWKVAP